MWKADSRLAWKLHFFFILKEELDDIFYIEMPLRFAVLLDDTLLVLKLTN